MPEFGLGLIGTNVCVSLQDRIDNHQHHLTPIRSRNQTRLRPKIEENMELPKRVQWRGHGWLYFVTMLVLDTILAAVIAFGPSVGLWFFLAPGDFFQRLIAVLFCGVLFIVMGIVAFFFWVYFITGTTGY